MKALVGFYSRRLAERFGMRAARVYALGLAVSFALLAFLARRGATAGTMDALISRALGYASWVVAGLSALSAARDLAARDRDEGLSALVALRGYDAWRLELARVLAVASRIAVWLFVPTAALVLFAWLLLASPKLAAWAATWCIFLAGYALALGLCLGVLARASAALSPERGRTVLAAIVLLPELLRGAWPAAPSVPRAFSWAIERAFDVGQRLV